MDNELHQDNDDVIDIEQDMSTFPAEVKHEIEKVEQTGITANYLKQLDFVAQNIDKFVTAQEKIWQAILKIAREGDWVIFGGEDSDKKSVCLSGPGAERIASRVGVSFSNWKEKKEVINDKIGIGYRYWFECDASFGGRTVRAIGRASSRDKFFGKAKGEWKELSDIAEDNIRMAAFRGAMKEGVRILFGLRNIPREAFDKAGIKLVSASAYNFKKASTQVSQPAQEPSSDPHPESSNSAVCEGCGIGVSAKVAKFSIDKKGKVLCFDCQKKY